MKTLSWASMVSRVIPAVATVGLLVAPAARAQVRDRPDVSQIPKAVMDALRARFPQAEIRVWTREEEEGVVLYDIEFTQQGRNFEADIIEDGTIHNWEREIGAEDLPQVVKEAVQSKYPAATIKEIMAITAVEAGNEALEGYEIVLDTADGRAVEITVAPDGTILEEGPAEPSHR